VVWWIISEGWPRVGGVGVEQERSGTRHVQGSVSSKMASPVGVFWKHHTLQRPVSATETARCGPGWLVWSQDGGERGTHTPLQGRRGAVRYLVLIFTCTGTCFSVGTAYGTAAGWKSIMIQPSTSLPPHACGLRASR
jgi:hypothetical protein